MFARHNPPGNLKDFDKGKDPESLYESWHQFIADAVRPTDHFPAWYDSMHPPSAEPPATRQPPWQGLPRTALLLNRQDVAAAARAVDAPVAFGSGIDALLVEQFPFLDKNGNQVGGVHYRAQDEYLEWVTNRDPDGVVREVLFTCEPPEYWQAIADIDRELLVALYAEIIGVTPAEIDRGKLFFDRDVTHVERFAQGSKLKFAKGRYNPYNDYNTAHCVHLTQGANTLGAEIGLAQVGSLIWGRPPKTSNPALICCGELGEPNRNSDPTIGKEVNDLARQRFFVTLRDPIGLYINAIADADFTDWNGEAIPNLATDYFVRTRKDPNDDSMTLRARFAVPAGVLRDGKQARVGDLLYKGVPIEAGGQVADAVTMHLFAQAIPGAPAQEPQPCSNKCCDAPRLPGFLIQVRVKDECPPAETETVALRRLAPASGARGKFRRLPS